MENINKNIDALNVEKLIEICGSKDWPKGKKFTVNLDGKEFKVQTYLSKGKDKFPNYGYDAHEAIETIYERELSEKEIFWEHEGPQYADPAFNDSMLTDLKKSQIEHRRLFAIAISNLINNQETIDAIADAAQKKKNGTFYKGRLVRIANIGIAQSPDRVWAIIGRAKTDDSMSITIEDVVVRAGDNEIWENEFILQDHAGLPVTEALKSIL